MAITSEEQAAWQSATQKNLTLSFVLKNGTTKVIDNSGIVAESMSLRQTISDNATNIFGNVYASQFNVRVFDDGTRLKGATLTATLSVTLENVNGYLVDSNGNRIIDSNGNYLMVSSGEDVTYSKQLGVFEVESDKLTSDGIFRDLVCYDSLSGVLGADCLEWHTGITYPTTVKNYRNAFFAYLNLEEEEITLPNDSLQIMEYVPKKISGAEIISSILMVNGCWGYLGMDNEFHYALPHTTPDHVISDNSFIQGSFAFEEFTTSEYSGVIIKNNIITTITETDTETGESTSYEDVREQKVIAGDDTGSIITMQDNVLLHGKSDAELQLVGTSILNALDGFTYTPASISFPPYMGIELGEVFQVTVPKGTYTFPVLDRTLSGITGLRDVFTAQGVEYSTENTNSMRTLMSQYQAQDVSLSDLIGRYNRMASNADRIASVTSQYLWHVQNVIYYRSTDTAVNNAKTYYELVGTVFTPIETPVGNPSEEGWYEAFADTGVHITEIPKEEFVEDPMNGGGNLLARSNGVAVRNGLRELATFGETTIIGADQAGGFTVEANQSQNTTADVFKSVYRYPTWVLTREPTGSIEIRFYERINGTTPTTRIATFACTLGIMSSNTVTYNSKTCDVTYDGYKTFTFVSPDETETDGFDYSIHYQFLYTSANLGFDNVADNSASMAIGTGLQTTSGNQLVVGQYNDPNNDYVFAVGYGSESFPGDRFGVDALGNVYMYGNLTRENRVLWAGTPSLMVASTTITLGSNNGFNPLSAQSNGYLLVWSAYVNGAAADYDWSYYFVPKYHVLLSGTGGVDIPIAQASTDGNGQKWAVKYLYITEDSNKNTYIKGYAGNGTGNAANYCLRAVLGI